jgi:membrane fusion protein, multidrug efflux system
MKKILTFICPTILFIASCGHEEHEEHEETTYVVTQPIRTDTLIYKEYVCQIQSIQHIELRSLERGYLQNIYVDEGQFVKKGQVLFQIMPLLFQAELEKAQAEAEFAKIEYQNTKNLSDSNIVSKNELALAKAKLDKALAELSLAQTHLGFTEIKAPFDGIIDRFHVRLGSLVDEGELLTSLSDNSKMWVYYNVPEAEYLDYITGPTADSLLKVSLQMANEQLFDQTGIVETIEADFNNETGNIAFRATFPNPKGILRHGETGNILMPVYLKNALLIPQKATFEILDKKYVYVVGPDNIARSTQITVGSEMPHIYTVLTGIKEGDKILVEGIRKVKNNQEIKYDFIEQQKILKDLDELHAE